MKLCYSINTRFMSITLTWRNSDDSSTEHTGLAGADQVVRRHDAQVVVIGQLRWARQGARRLNHLNLITM